MATLLDTLQKTLGQATASEAPAAGEETATVQRLLSAKRGIVGGPKAPTGLAVGEMAAQAAVQPEMAKLGQAAQLESTSLLQQAAGEAEEVQQRKQNIAAQRQQSQLQARIQSDAILRGLEQGRATLSEAQRRSGMEQVASQLRLSNDAYITNLEMEGARSRLQNKIDFDMQLKRDIMADNIALLEMQIGNKKIIDMSDDEFRKELAKIDINTAIAMQKENAKFSAQQQQIQALGQAGTTAIGAYGKYSEAEEAGKLDPGYQAYRTKSLQQGIPERDLDSYERYSYKEQLKGGPPAPGTPLGRK